MRPPRASRLIEIDAERFSLAIEGYTRSYFLTARLAARRMIARRSGVIVTITAYPAGTGTPNNGKASGMRGTAVNMTLGTLDD